MSRSASGHLTLTRLGESTLYAPTPRDTWVFLLWDSTDPPGSLPLDDTWADQGLPAHTGWYVYLRTALAPADAAAAEQTLRSAISRPAATGCAWSTYHPGSQAGLLGAVPVRLDKQDRPVIATDTPVMLPSGVTQFCLVAGMRVKATLGDAGNLQGLVITQPTHDGPWAGIGVSLTGVRAGCITFPALLASTVDGGRSTKLGAQVSLDPLRPFDPRRTRTTPSGVQYDLIAESDGSLRLEPRHGHLAPDSA